MKTTGKVQGIISNIVIVRVDGPVSQNEICHITVGGVQLMGAAFSDGDLLDLAALLAKEGK